jgi:SpoVK/Ycf46/Vps4 family AAA+-type ATPase
VEVEAGYGAALAELLANAADVRTDVAVEHFRTILGILRDEGGASDDGPTDGQELAALKELRRLKEAISVTMSYFVEHARAANRTWAEIGQALGTSPQNAQRNYRRLVMTTNYDGLLEQLLLRPHHGTEEAISTTEPIPLPRALKGVIEAHRTDSQNPPRAVFLWGPPGSGKSSLAARVAESLDWPLAMITPADVLRSGLDNIPRELASVFGRLERMDRVVVVLDEMDEFLGDRETTDVGRRLLTIALLSAMRRLREANNSILIIATNRSPTGVDPALVRPGRTDAIIEVHPRNTTARRSSRKAVRSAP